MTRRLAWIASTLAAASLACTPPGPAAGPSAPGPDLAAGSEAMIVSGSGSSGILMETEKGRGSIGGDLEDVAAGTRARVVFVLDDPADDPRVRVLLLDGKHPGLPGTLRRSELQPLP